MNEAFSTIISTLLAFSLVLAAFAWFFRTIISEWIKAHIDHLYQVRISEYERKLEAKERSQLVAELLAEWMASPLEDQAMTSEQRKRLNTLSFQATLWLPEQTARDLARILQLSPSATNQFDILLQVRRHLIGQHSLETKDVTHWPREAELPNRGLPLGVTRGQLLVREISVISDDGESPLSSDDMADGFDVPDGGEIAFVLVILGENDKTIEIRTRDIRHIKLLEETRQDGRIVTQLISVHPNEIADDINRSLHGDNVRSNE